MFVCSVIDASEIPKALREARLSPEWPSRDQAYLGNSARMTTHCHTYKTVDSPPTRTVIPTHWIFAPNINGEWHIHQFKAGLVVNAFLSMRGGR